MPISGKEMLKLFEKHGWIKVRQKGSHVVVYKDGHVPETIPMHKELKNGLEKKLLKRLGEKKMNYHFKIHKEKSGYWAECLEIPSCSTQGETLEELKSNADEALNLLLDEPENSKVMFPLPSSAIKNSKNIFRVKVEPSIAFAFLMRRTRLEKGLRQDQMKSLLRYKTLFSYQKLENAKYANPTLKTLQHILECIPDFPFELLFMPASSKR